MTARLSALWVRNVIGAVVTAAAVGVLVVIGLGESWSTYRHTVVPGAVVPAGHSGAAGGRTWKVDSIRHLESQSGELRPAAAARHRAGRCHRRPLRTPARRNLYRCHHRR